MSRVIVSCTAILLVVSSDATAQGLQPLSSARWNGAVPDVLAEHATGGEVPATVGVASLGALIVFDIATAPASARWHNARNPDGPHKSPGSAFMFSLAATGAPLLIGGALAGGSDETAVILIMSGIVIGPSVGHFYSRRAGRGLATAALRLGIGLVTSYVVSCCT